MELRQKVLPVTLLVVVFGLTMLALILQARTPTASALLKNLSAATNDMTSFEYKMAGSQTLDSGLVDSGYMIVQLEFPSTMYSRQFDSDDNLLYEMKQIGETAYNRDGGSGSWTASEKAEVLSADVTEAPASDLVDSVTEFLVDVEVIGIEMVNGISARHLRGQTDMAAKAAVLWPNWDAMPAEQRSGLEDVRSQYLAGSEVVDFWINAETSTLVRSQIMATYPAVGDEEGYTASLIIDVSRYNDDFNIEAPTQIR